MATAAICIAAQFRQANPAPTASASASCPLIPIYNKTTSSASSPGRNEHGAKSEERAGSTNLVVGQALPLPAPWATRSCGEIRALLLLAPSSLPNLPKILPSVWTFRYDSRRDRRTHSTPARPRAAACPYPHSLLFLFVLLFLIPS